jgi:hypothetical protein
MIGHTMKTQKRATAGSKNKMIVRVSLDLYDKPELRPDFMTDRMTGISMKNLLAL